MPDVIGATPDLEIPTEIHGFAVEVGIGPYPANHRRSHRRAIYVILRPTTQDLADKLRRAGHHDGRIVGCGPLDATTARQLQEPLESPARPTVDEQERLVLEVLRPAATIAKKIHDAPR